MNYKSVQLFDNWSDWKKRNKETEKEKKANKLQTNKRTRTDEEEGGGGENFNKFIFLFTFVPFLLFSSTKWSTLFGIFSSSSCSEEDVSYGRHLAQKRLWPCIEGGRYLLEKKEQKKKAKIL